MKLQGISGNFTRAGVTALVVPVFKGEKVTGGVLRDLDKLTGGLLGAVLVAEAGTGVGKTYMAKAIATEGATLSSLSVKERLRDLQIEEAILALDSTLEGDATALYLKEQLEPMEISVSRLAFGLPMGSPLEYVDGGTLRRALVGRRGF